MNGTRNIGVAGIVGTGGTLSRCYNLGKIEGKRASGDPWVGGVVGQTDYNVEYCCNVGNIIYTGDSTKYVGTLGGRMSVDKVSNSYTLTNAQLNGVGTNYSEPAGLVKANTAAEMPTVLEIVGNGFKADTNNINNGYPILSWQ